MEILSVILPQARHAQDGKRVTTLSVVRCLSLKSSNPDAFGSMFDAIKAVLRGSKGRLAFPYQRIGMIQALQELSNALKGKYLNNLCLHCMLLSFKLLQR